MGQLKIDQLISQAKCHLSRYVISDDQIGAHVYRLIASKRRITSVTNLRNKKKNQLRKIKKCEAEYETICISCLFFMHGT